MLIANALDSFDEKITFGDNVAIFSGEAYVYRKILLAAERADHPAKLVRHKFEYSTLNGDRQMLEFLRDAIKSKHLWWMWIADGAAALESKAGKNPQDDGVEVVQVYRADGAGGIVVEEWITDEGSSLLPASSQISLKNSLLSAINLPVYVPGLFCDICPLSSPDIATPAAWWGTEL